MAEEDESQDRQWHLDKKVPIALILSILAQTFAFGWWGASTAARIDQLERQATQTAPQGERIIRLETKLDGVAEAIADLKMLIRRSN